MDVSLFMADKAGAVEKVEFVVTDRFKDGDGNAIPWVLFPVSCTKEKEIKRQCTKNGHFDNFSYTEQLTAETVLEPNLADASLQDSYKCMGKTDLLAAMLTSGEFNKLTLKALEVNGLNQPLQSIVDEAKN
jgi:hypothetical protein